MNRQSRFKVAICSAVVSGLMLSAASSAEAKTATKAKKRVSKENAVLNLDELAASVDQQAKTATPESKVIVVKEVIREVVKEVPKTDSPTIGGLVWNGELAARLENIDRVGSNYRSRLRYAFRLNSQVPVSEKTTVKFGFSSGGTSARSIHQTFGGDSGNTAKDGIFSQNPIRISHAFIQHQLCPESTLNVGKMTNPIWSPSELIWDRDIYPEGASIVYESKGTGSCQTFASVAYLVGGEMLQNNVQNARIYEAQIGTRYKLFGFDARSAVAYTAFENVQGVATANLTNGVDAVGKNNSVSAGKLVFGYTPITFASEIDLSKASPCKNFVGYTEVVYNTAAQGDSVANTGFIVGLKFGSAAKVRKTGEWTFDSSYRYLGNDAWLDILPESSFYSGNTGVKGVKLNLQYGLSDGLALCLTSFFAESLIAGQKSEALYHVDLKATF